MIKSGLDKNNIKIKTYFIFLNQQNKYSILQLSINFMQIKQKDIKTCACNKIMYLQSVEPLFVNEKDKITQYTLFGFVFKYS